MITVQIPGIGAYTAEANLYRISFRLGELGNKIRLENIRKTDEDFRNSLLTAKIVAERIAGKRFDHDIILTGTGSSDYSGESMGLMAALGMLSLLTGKALKPGVTGTGRINQKGEVLPAGNIQKKVEAAKAAGASVFIMAYHLDEFPRGLNYFIVSLVESAWKWCSE